MIKSHKEKIDEDWKDYDGEQLQVCIDGKTYLVNSVNIVMTK